MKKYLLISMSCTIALVAFTAAPALATGVKAASGIGTAVKGKLTSPFASFTPDSGTGAITVECKASSLAGGWPPDVENKPSTVNTTEAAGGSVADDLTTTPTFGECTTAGAATTVATNSTNGRWSVDWQVMNNVTSPWNTFEFGIPKAAATISITGTTCVITFSSKEATSVSGFYTNGSASTASRVAVNEEIPFEVTSGCAALGLENKDSPVAFHAIYAISDQTSTVGVIEE